MKCLVTDSFPSKIRVLLSLLVFGVIPTNVSFGQDSAMLEAANKEGKIVWYTSLSAPSATFIVSRFKAKYPGIDVEIDRRGSSISGTIEKIDEVRNEIYLRDRSNRLSIVSYDPNIIVFDKDGLSRQTSLRLGNQVVIYFSPETIFQRVISEATADLKNVDVIHTSNLADFALLKEKGLLLKYVPNGTDVFPLRSKTKMSSIMAYARHSL
jgi:hypothetical protein